MDQIRVLLADDHPIIRAGIRLLLEKADDITVIGETDRGDDVVGLVGRLQPDILLLDMEMPGKSGAAVAQELKQSGADVRVLVLSAYDDDEYIASLLATGAAGYLTKEEALNTIVEAVRGVARGEDGWYSRRAVAQIAALARKEQSRPGVDLTEREEEVLKMLAEGWTNMRMANELTVSERTIRFHLSNIYDKLGVSSRAEAISWALKRDART
jgi:DNA-binding NarL/FixJ family response regulator